MAKTKIEWADRVWNPVTGCTKVSQGCKNCYAERIASRFWGGRGFTDVHLHFDRLNDPSRWKKPSMVFVNSMSDLFHESLINRPEWSDFITQVWLTMLRNVDRHTFMILTKRPQIMEKEIKYLIGAGMIILPNVWLGTSVEDQKTLDLRLPFLLNTPGAKRFISYEPALEPINILSVFGGDLYAMHEGIDWVICGCESGTGARPMHLDWVRRVRDQCQRALIPFFFKQAVIDGKLVKMPELDGKVWNEFPRSENHD